jgi:hypothetical protein
MESHLVRRDLFNVSPQGIIHKPTDAAFTPYFGDPRLGTMRLGRLLWATRRRFDPSSSPSASSPKVMFSLGELVGN